MLHAARRSEPRTAEFHHEAENSKYFREKGRYFVFEFFALSGRQKFILMIGKFGLNKCSFTGSMLATEQLIFVSYDPISATALFLFCPILYAYGSLSSSRLLSKSFGSHLFCRFQAPCCPYSAIFSPKSTNSPWYQLNRNNRILDKPFIYPMRVVHPVSARPFPATIFHHLELNQTSAILSTTYHSSPPSKQAIPSHLLHESTTEQHI